jgi:hypothetical protein
MTDLSKKACVVVHNSLFLEIAIRLSKEFGRGRPNDHDQIQQSNHWR